MKHFKSTFFRYALAASGMALSAAMVYADDAATPVAPATTTAVPAAAPTKHQLMKECMRKEKAAISGRENYDLAAECRDITRTEKQNADAEKSVSKKADDKNDSKTDSDAKGG